MDPSRKHIGMNSTWSSLLYAVGAELHPKHNHSFHSNLTDYEHMVYPSFLSSSTFLSHTISNHSLLRNHTYSTEVTSSKVTTTVLILLVSLMTLITVTGNLLVIIAFICDPRIRTYSNCFILNLSIADLLVGLICIPLYAHKFIFDQWYLGYHLCKLWLVFDYVVGSASTLCIVVISYDRYQMVSKGLNYLSQSTTQRALKFVLGTWIIAILNYAPAIVLWDWLPGSDPYEHQNCDAPFEKNFPYLVTTAFVEFFVPFFSLTTLNLLVYLNIRRRSRGFIRTNTLKLKQNGRLLSLASSHTSTEPNLKASTKHTKSTSLARDRRAAKNLFILVLTFVMCWCPYTLLTLVRALCVQGDKCVSSFTYEIAFWLLWLNSTINPFLYSCLHVKFREAFYRILCFHQYKNRHRTRVDQV